MAETKTDVTAIQFRSGRVYSGAWSPEREARSVPGVGLVLDVGVHGGDILIDELSEGFSSALALAHSYGWEMSDFDRRFAEVLARSREAVGRANMADISKDWQELGEKLGFDGVLDDLAVIVDDPEGRLQNNEALIGKVKGIVDGLGSAGRPHAAVAVVASDLPHAVENKIFQAGAQVIDVPKGFYDLGVGDQRAFLQLLFLPEDSQLPPPASASKNPDADPTRYIARNADLSEEDVANWWRRLAAPLSRD